MLVLSGTIGLAPNCYTLKGSRRRNNMTKFKTIGAICLAVSLAAASPSFAAGKRGGHGGGFHGRGAHFAHGGGHRGGGIGVAAGLIAGSAFRGAYGYYGARGDSYGYSGREIYDRSTNENGNSN
jgi:hypothetical protein